MQFQLKKVQLFLEKTIVGVIEFTDGKLLVCVRGLKNLQIVEKNTAAVIGEISNPGTDSYYYAMR